MGERAMDEHAATLAKKGMDVNVGVTKRPIHGVLKCLICNASGAECETGPRILESTAMSTPPSTSAKYSHVWLSTARDPGTSSSQRLGPVIITAAKRGSLCFDAISDSRRVSVSGIPKFTWLPE